MAKACSTSCRWKRMNTSMNDQTRPAAWMPSHCTVALADERGDDLHKRAHDAERYRQGIPVARHLMCSRPNRRCGLILGHGELGGYNRSSRMEPNEMSCSYQTCRSGATPEQELALRWRTADCRCWPA